jgi:hypothetical protein
VQLREFLYNGGSKKVNIIAVSWKEGRYGNSSPGRLRSMVRKFHPAIRVIRANAKIEKDFAPLVNVPMNFIFNKQGALVYGTGDREYLDTERLREILASINAEKRE